MNHQLARDNMIEQQIRPWDVLDQRVLDTLASTPRESFLPEQLARLAFSDSRLPIGHGQSMLNPALEGRILQALTLSATDKVLEIGTGSGYLTACLAKLSMQVDSIDIIAELIELAGTNLAPLQLGNIHLDTADASENFQRLDRYDAIVFNGAVPAVDQHYKELLNINGRLLCFIGSVNEPVHQAQLTKRISEHEWSTQTLFETWVPALQNFA